MASNVLDAVADRGLRRLYAIADADTWGLEELPNLVETWVGLGVGCIQLRAKGVSESRLLSVAKRCVDRLEGSDAAFWVNDSAAVARAVGATGVHLGQQDLQPSEARGLLQSDQLIGLSTHNRMQAAAAQANPAVDVVALGPLFATESKQNPDPVIGFSLLEEICGIVSKPLVAIGGIGAAECRPVLEAGASSVAMIGALRAVGAVERLLALTQD